MSLEYYELRKRQKGDEKAAAFARVLREQFGDESLPSGEALVEVKRFSPEAREALEKEGYVIYALTGQSIRSLRESGRKFWYVDSALENLVSNFGSEVAINPQEFFLPDSFGKLPREQEELVAKFNRQLVKKIPGVQAVIADEPSVWAEIYHQHFEATKKVLFGSKHNFFYTVTKTGAGFGFAIFGSTCAGHGPRVGGWSPERRPPDMGVARLVVPK